MRPGDYQLTIESSADGCTQPFRLFVPQASCSDGKPLVLALHGRGVDHNAWFDLTPVKQVAQEHGYVVAAPLGRPPSYYADAGEQDVLDIRSKVIQLCDVDPRRVYLTGHSMGGWGTWNVALRNPHLFAAVCPMSGMAPITLLPNARYLSPLLIHDVGDDVVPVCYSRNAAQQLAQLGISFCYREEIGYGHSSSMIGDNLDRVLSWFNNHRLVTQPPVVGCVATGHTPVTTYWVRVTKAFSPDVPASVSGRITATGDISLTTSLVCEMAINRSDLPSRVRPDATIEINGRAACSIGNSDSSGADDWIVLEP